MCIHVRCMYTYLRAQVKVLLPLSIGDLRDLLVHKSEDSGGNSVPNSVGVNSQLTVNYNTGAIQVCDVCLFKEHTTGICVSMHLCMYVRVYIRMYMYCMFACIRVSIQYVLCIFVKPVYNTYLSICVY